jgi:hypothetical protein
MRSSEIGALVLAVSHVPLSDGVSCAEQFDIESMTNGCVMGTE